MKYAFLILITVLIGCSDENLNINPLTLEGKWVDVNTKTDTIIFEFNTNQETMILNRGVEMRNGFLLPKTGSGSYSFELLSDDTISLQWHLSSNSTYNNYYFKQSGNEFTIEKFFDSPAPGVFLTFKKID